VLNHLRDVGALLDIAVEHAPNEVDAFVANSEWNTQIAVHDFVDTVKWVLLVNDGVEEDAKGPDILLLAAVRFSSQNLGGCII
jgi:hypothetical protein